MLMKNPIETREFKWMPEHQQAFDALKEALVAAPVLGYPDFNREFVLETDASLQGLGTVLSQQDETGRLHVRHPHTEEETKNERGSNHDEVEVISYLSVCEVVDEYLDISKVPDDLKKEALSISCMANLLLRKRMWKISRVCSILCLSSIR